jgi:hypothetical protein
MATNFEEFVRAARWEWKDIDYVRHPSEALLQGYVYEALPSAALSRIAAHVATCRVCRESVSQLRTEVAGLTEALAPVEARAKERVLRQLRGRSQERSVAEREHGSPFPGATSGLWRRLRAGPWLRTRRSFWVHISTYALVGAALATLWLIAAMPEFQMQGVGNKSSARVWDLARSVLTGLGIAWALWSSMVVLHALRTFRGSKTPHRSGSPPTRAGRRK